MSKTDDDTDGGRGGTERSPGREPKHGEEELLADLRRVARTVSGTVSEREYAERGAYGVTTFRRRFGSWNAAKDRAGLETREPERIDEERLLDDLRRVARSASGTLTEREYAERGAYGVTTFRRRFGSWNAAKHAAGLDAARREQTTAAMRDDIARVADATDDTYVTPETYAERGEYPLSALPADDEFWDPLRDRVGLAVVLLRRKAVANHESDADADAGAPSGSGAPGPPR